jgi:hypothetical protein
MSAFRGPAESAKPQRLTSGAFVGKARTMTDTAEATTGPAFSRPLAEVEDRWMTSLDDDDVYALCERLCDAVARPFETDDESLAVQVVSALYAIGELGAGLLTAETLEVVLLSILPRHALVPPTEAKAIVEELTEALPFFLEEQILAAEHEAAVRAYLADEALVARVEGALGNMDLYDDEKREFVSEELERDAMARAAQKAAKVRATAKKKAKSKASRQARKKQRR